jgi:predicted RNase H-like HicB family nuclease
MTDIVREHYPITITWDDTHQQYIATATEYTTITPGHPVTAPGKTREEALTNIQAIMKIILHAYIECANLPLPSIPIHKNAIILPDGPDEV